MSQLIDCGRTVKVQFKRLKLAVLGEEGGLKNYEFVMKVSVRIVLNTLESVGKVCCLGTVRV